MKWQLNNIKYPVYNLGFGKRIGIWVQGCDLGCKGCINMTLWNNNNGKGINVLDTYNLIIDLCEEYDGITISGGEPFQQYEALITFIYLIKKNTSLDIFCFTGYELEEINELYPDMLYSKYIDRLMTGRYIEEIHSNDNIRGSSNQKLFQFVKGKPLEIKEKFTESKLGLHVGLDGQIQMTAIPKKNEIKQIELSLKEKNIIKKFI
jgi:anaerobic ribonucleoside-triphosphate reductase activating protein